jgi:hypothetical protein|tara:strand:- start:37 stop:171 length:135 start_codon:yes stop_codon:yes gene_type:complete
MAVRRQNGLDKAAAGAFIGPMAYTAIIIVAKILSIPRMAEVRMP